MRMALLAALLVVALAPLLHAQPAERPNFIVIIADDLAWDDVGAYGNPAVRTPNIDRLAREGMRFDAAFLTCSSCSPSRASINTGRYPHSTGAGELHLPIPADQRLFTTPLREAGYYTAAAGKWHMGPDARKQYDSVAEGGGPSGCEAWVKTLADRPKDKPFFLWLASFDPHRDYKPGTIAQPHSPADVRVPPYLPDVPETRGDLALYYDEITRLDGFVGQVLDELDRQGVARNTLVLFISDNGRPFPRCKTTVYDSGVRTPWIVRWPAAVSAGSVNGQLVSSVDIAPTLVELGGGKVSATFQGRSFAPLLRDPAAAIREHVFSEHNWHDYSARERSVRTVRHLYIRNEYADLTGSPPADAVRSPTFQAMVRLHDAGKLPPQQAGPFMKPRPAEELYDVQADPHQLHNLAADAKLADVLGAMRATLDNWKKQTDDTSPATRRPDEFDRRTGEFLPGYERPARKSKAKARKTR